PRGQAHLLLSGAVERAEASRERRVGGGEDRAVLGHRPSRLPPAGRLTRRGQRAAGKIGFYGWKHIGFGPFETSFGLIYAGAGALEIAAPAPHNKGKEGASESERIV